MISMRASVITASLLLAACGSGENAQEENNSLSAVVGTIQSAPENLTDDQRNEAVPLETPKPTPTPDPEAKATSARAGTLPTAFQGRWGLVANDCDPSRSDAKGLMEVGPMTLKFYESRGVATRVAQPRPDRVEGTFSFDGEGMKWTNEQTLTLQDSGRTLVREQKESDQPGSFTYRKCPAKS